MPTPTSLFDPRGPLFDNPRTPAARTEPGPLPPYRAHLVQAPAPPIPTPRSVTEGRARAERALGAVDRRAPWLAIAESVIRRLAARGQEFTSDDVWDELEKTGANPPADQRRSIGSAFKALQRRGAILATNQLRLSKRVDCHGRGVRVWRPCP
jgi:hypothetical protein